MDGRRNCGSQESSSVKGQQKPKKLGKKPAQSREARGCQADPFARRLSFSPHHEPPRGGNTMSKLSELIARLTGGKKS
jgi:hypothetical protein